MSEATDLCGLSAAQLAAGYASGAFSPVEVMRAVLDRTDRLNPKLNAFFFLDREGALIAARASEQRWLKGQALGPLDGVPVSIKDSIAIAGTPMFRGAAPFRHRPPSAATSPPAARLLEGGAILFGKTTMPDLGLLAAGVSSAHGVTRNPWNLAMNTGGSSSGGVAAVAAGLGPLTVGSDLGGSVRIPAALCGLATIKPTQGRIPHLPPSAIRSAGPIARNIEDAALLFGILAQPDGRDYGSLAYDGQTYDDLSLPDIRGWRIGVIDSMGFGPRAEQPIRDTVGRAARCLAEAGAEVTPIGPLVDFDPTDAFASIFSSRGLHEVAQLSAEERDQLHPAIQRLTRQAESMSVETLLRANDVVDRAKASVIERTHAFDIILAPATPVVSFPAEDASPDPDQVHSIVTFTSMFNQTGQPAAVICGGFSPDGLPIGIQLIGRRHEDLRVLRAAAFCEAALGLTFNWPC